MAGRFHRAAAQGAVAEATAVITVPDYSERLRVRFRAISRATTLRGRGGLVDPEDDAGLVGRAVWVLRRAVVDAAEEEDGDGRSEAGRAAPGRFLVGEHEVSAGYVHVKRAGGDAAAAGALVHDHDDIHVVVGSAIDHVGGKDIDEHFAIGVEDAPGFARRGLVAGDALGR